ncbi:glycosyl hydrolase [Aridibaculum aurantiacum]|uniref:glycosyl hydrolase n=1 Tax=Aridibaculum aurantiacum TaxID=2810307 RepID=UPI001A97397B|nr:glycosyl hydrolase [Aridibaculum aurantiacum]
MKKIIIAFVLSVLVLQGHAQIWPAITQTAKPWTRWWWMGSAVDEKNISSQLSTYQKAGFGGVEVVPIYGAKGHESKYIPYLSPQWMKMLDHTVKQSTGLGMGVYISVGTGWPIGGPQVTTEDAATRLVIQQYTVKAGEPLKDKVLINDARQKDVAKLTALMAYGKDEKLDITDKVQADGTLNWTPAAGEWKLFAAFSSKTKQAVKRAAPGGEGYTLDHFSKASLTNYFKKWDTAFGNTARGVKAFYNDSYEVYNADWTPAFFDEFKRRRGYDLRYFLREMASTVASEEVARVKSDYRQTMSDLMLENFSKTFTKYAHDKKTKSLNQAHGSPGNLLDLYAAFDIPETETFGSSYFPIPGLRRDSADVRNVDPDPNMLKFASSAAHAMGNKLTSSETFTWLTEHFKTSWAQCKPEVEQVFLSGVNHVFYHGTTYSPDYVQWPGWLFYASVNFVPNNSLWPHLQGLNNYIARCQSVLQSGEPDNEIMAYWPVYDAWHNAKGTDMPLKVHDIDHWLHPTPFYKNLVQLQERGYSMDFVSDKMLSEASVTNGIVKVSKNGAAHKVLLVSKCKMMPVATLQNIIRLANAGAIIVLEEMPADVPGLDHYEQQRASLAALIATLNFQQKGKDLSEVVVGKGKIILSKDVMKALEYAGVKREVLVDSGLKFIRRSVNGGKYYYLVNHTPNTINANLPIQFAANSVVIMDPQSGDAGMAAFTKKGNTTDVRLQIKPGEALNLKATTAKPATTPKWKYLETLHLPFNLEGKWQLSFKEGGPSLPAARTLQQLQNWTDLTDDTATQNFSGTGVYTTTFNLPAKRADEYLLQLGKVNESARVTINGKEVGILWSIPYETRIGKYLKTGQNTITIEVANLMANRIRYMDRMGMEWRKYHEINFVNIDYKSFDASKWKVQPSGLEGPVTISPFIANPKGSAKK